MANMARSQTPNATCNARKTKKVECVVLAGEIASLTYLELKDP